VNYTVTKLFAKSLCGVP